MRLKTEFRASLESGANHDELAALVRRHKASGLSQREAYDQLQQLWVEYGFDADDHDGENPVRDNLEYIMEIVWGFCPAERAIWEDSLSTQNQPT
ncbi:MAG: hypothetical protein AB7U20_23360 [Planctomycetaceae bacterium]